MKQTLAKIYLSDQRCCTQTDAFRSFHTFNFGSFFDENKKPFGNLTAFNEDTLKGNASIKHTIAAQTTVILMPIRGVIGIKDANNPDGTARFDWIEMWIPAGEAYLFTTVHEEAITIHNPFDSELVSYLQIHLQNNDYQPFNAESIAAFDFANAKNQLLPYFDDGKYYGSIGQFDGRKDSVYSLKNPKNGVFAFVVEGVFEVQNRLLHARDGLALWDIEEVELEALSNDAVILLIEVAFILTK
jgi:quercetin 2,3-dioxygenase